MNIHVVSHSSKNGMVTFLVKMLQRPHLKILDGHPKHHGVATPTHRFGHCETTKPDHDDYDDGVDGGDGADADDINCDADDAEDGCDETWRHRPVKSGWWSSQDRGRASRA